MSLFRKVLARGAVQLAKNSKNAPMKLAPCVASQRSLSSILEGRETAEETRYIRNLEAAKKAEIRANIERILALEDGHEEKAGLVELLGNF